MLKMSLSSQQIAIAGRVLEGETDRAISGAMVEIIDMPESFRKILSLKALQYGAQWEKMSDRPDRKFTASDGSFYFVNLPTGVYFVDLPTGVDLSTGKYTLAAFIPSSRIIQYGIKEFTVTKEKSSERIITTLMDIPLVLTTISITIKGQITDFNDSKKKISSAKIEVLNSLGSVKQAVIFAITLLIQSGLYRLASLLLQDYQSLKKTFLNFQVDYFINFEGNYLLGLKAAAEKKKIPLKISAPGYQDVTELLDIDTEKIIENNFSLKPKEKTAIV